MRVLTIIAALLLMPYIFVSVGTAHQGATGIVKDRMDRFSATKRDLRSALKSAKTNDFDDVIAKARLMVEWGQIMPSYFPPGSDQPPSEARATVWQDQDGFRAASLAMATAAETVISAAEQGDAAATITALQSLGQTCGACHRSYRQ